jgi:hypothetical protein
MLSAMANSTVELMDIIFHGTSLTVLMTSLIDASLVVGMAPFQQRWQNWAKTEEAVEEAPRGPWLQLVLLGAKISE